MLRSVRTPGGADAVRAAASGIRHNRHRACAAAGRDDSRVEYATASGGDGEAEQSEGTIGADRSGRSITIYVREPATEGKANKAVAELLAAHLGVPKSRVNLIGGATSRTKRFRVA